MQHTKLAVLLISVSLILVCGNDKIALAESIAGDAPAEALRISVSLNKTSFKMGDEFIANVVFQNISDRKLHFYYCSIYPAFNLQMINEKGELIKAMRTVMYDLAIRDPKSFFNELVPGETKNFEMKAKIILSYYPEKGVPTIAFFDVDHQLKDVGKFKIYYNYETNKYISDLSEKANFKDVRLGQVISNSMEFNVSLPLKNEIDEKIKLLGSGSQREKEEAIDFLQANQVSGALPYLIKIIEEENNPLQNKATDAIWMIGDKRSLPDLSRIYEQKIKNNCTADEQIRILDTILRLEDNRDNIQKILINTIESNPSINVKRYAICELGYKCRDKELEDAELLMKLSADSESLIRLAAIQTLSTIAEYHKFPEDIKGKIIQVLVNIMKKDSDNGVKYTAIRGLGQIGNVDAIPILKEYNEKCEDKYCIEAIKKAVENIEFRETASRE